MCILSFFLLSCLEKNRNEKRVGEAENILITFLFVDLLIGKRFSNYKTLSINRKNIKQPILILIQTLWRHTFVKQDRFNCYQTNFVQI